jgi:hypothetical protein
MLRRHLSTDWVRRLLLVLAALGLGALLPAAVQAENLAFRNDTNAPLVIQGASVVKGQLRADQPVMIPPGAAARINLPGNKLVTIYHARLPNRPLYQSTIQGGNDDQYFSVQFDAASRVKLEQTKPFPVSGTGSMSGGPGTSR